MHNYDHFIKSHDIKFTGLHVLIDFKGVPTDIENLINTIEKSLDYVGATILHKNIHYFEENNGVTGCYLLAESHMAFHSWWEADGTIIMDFYTCGETNPLNALRILKNGILPRETTIKVLPRSPIYLQNNNKFFVYAIYDPRTNIPFYIGKGTKARLTTTLNYNNNPHQPEKNEKIKNIIDSGLHPELHIITENTIESLALLIESYLIDYYGTISNGGTLLNKTTIGNITNKIKITESLKKYHEQLTEEKKKERSENIKKGLSGIDQKRKDEIYKKRSENEEYRNKLKEASKKIDRSYMQNTEYKEKQKKGRTSYELWFNNGDKMIINDILKYCENSNINISCLRDRITGRVKKPLSNGVCGGKVLGKIKK